MLSKGDVINKRYEILDLISIRDKSTAYKAKDNELGKSVVLEIIFMNESEEWKEIELFKRQANTLKTLSHSGIALYIDYFESEINNSHAFILVREFINAQNLEILKQQHVNFNEDNVKNLLLKAFEILDYIHSLVPPVIHRNICPENLLRDENGNVYLTGFGAIGKLTRSTMVASQTFTGEIGFTPEEQILGKVIPESDIYALGMSAVFLLTGKRPNDLEGRGVEFVNDYVKGERLRKLLLKCVDSDYKMRLSSAKDGIDYLNNKIPYEKILKLSEKRVGNVNVTELNRNEKIVEIGFDKSGIGCRMAGLSVWMLFMVIFFFVSLFMDAPVMFSVVPIMFLAFGLFVFIKDLKNVSKSVIFHLTEQSLIVSQAMILKKKTLIPYSKFHGIAITDNESVSPHSGNEGNAVITVQNSLGEKLVFGDAGLISIAEAEFIKDVIEEHVSQNIVI